MYLLLHPKTMGEVLAAFPQLVASFARREPGSDEVLLDAFLEHAEWSHPTSWTEARKARDKRPKLNLFWVGNGRIRQNIYRVGVRGWKELDATVGVRRADRIAGRTT